MGRGSGVGGVRVFRRWLLNVVLGRMGETSVIVEMGLAAIVV